MYQESGYGEDNQSETSKYNEAGYQVQRLHNLWVRAEYYANAGQLLKWRDVLFSVWRELYQDVQRHDEKKEMMKENDKWILEIFKSLKKRDRLYYNLHKRHEFLKLIQDKAGKGGSYESTTEQDFD